MQAAGVVSILRQVLSPADRTRDASAFDWHIPESLVVRRWPGVVIHKLLDNAVKSFRGRSSAVFQLIPEAIHGTTRICIRDNCAGFVSRHVDKLFGEFQRLHPESEFSGSGVGLATVAGIIQRRGGFMKATAPRRAAQASVSPSARARATMAGNRTGGQIILVEDRPDSAGP